MANKNISNYNQAQPFTGDYLLFWDVSASGTRKTTINRLVALTPEEAEVFAVTGSVSGAKNVGPGAGTIFHSNQSGVLAFKTINAGSNITLLNNSGDVTINAADAPLVPVQSGRNVGFGEGSLYHSVTENALQIKTIKAGTGVSITNNTGDVTINFVSGVAFSGVQGSGNCFVVPFGGDGTTQPTWTPVTFTQGSPILVIPAGTANYMIDFIYTMEQGSTCSHVWVKFSGVNAADIPFSYRKFQNFPGQYHLRHVQSFTGPITLRPYALHSGQDDTAGDAQPRIASTGATFSYLRL